MRARALADRATFLVDPEGVIQFMEVTAEGIGRNAAELVRKVKAAQAVAAHPGEVCPAKWEGEVTLAPRSTSWARSESSHHRDAPTTGGGRGVADHRTSLSAPA